VNTGAVLNRQPVTAETLANLRSLTYGENGYLKFTAVASFICDKYPVKSAVLGDTIK
jgi:hypothetical protein